MQQLELHATRRETLGKKVRFLRRRGITPVHLFGHSVKSTALQCETAQLQRTLAQAGKTRLISLTLDKAKQPRNVVVREVQKDPQTGEVLHVDFYEVKMAEKIRVNVPVVLAGETPLLKLTEATLVQELNNLTIECFPDEIPSSVELDISSFTEVEQAIRVKDVTLSKGVTVLNDPEVVLARISTRPIEKAEEVREEIGKGEMPEAAPLLTKEPKKE